MGALEKATEAKARNSAMRATWRLRAANGETDLGTVLEAAAAPGGVALRKVAVADLIGDLYGFGPARSRRIVDKVADVSGARRTRRADLGWLLDTRACGRRVLALADELTPLRPMRPWPGFPWAPAPGEKEDEDEWGL